MRLYNDILPSFPELVVAIDDALMWEIDNEVTGVARALYNFFDVPAKRLNPRELLQFWLSLSEEEKLVLMVFPEQFSKS